MAAILEISYYNSFWLKRVQTGPSKVAVESPDGKDVYYDNVNSSLTWPGPSYYGDAIKNPLDTTQIKANVFVEESRIRGGYNNLQTDYGARAYLNEDNPIQKHRPNALIYSGLVNSLTGFNETNVFSTADSITKAVDPANGSIQKLYAEDTNLIVFQENKISRALIDKDAIFSAEGGGTITSTNLVIGQIVPYVGDYGISLNPESFAVYGYRKYFTDKFRNSVMRLSRDGLTEISQNGMNDYFRDNLPLINDNYTLQPGVSNFVSNVAASTLILTTPSTVSVGGKMQIGSDNSGWTDAVDSDGNNIFVTKINTSINNQIIVYLTSNPTVAIIPPAIDVRFLSYTKGFIIGGWDIHTDQYHLSLQQQPSFYSTSENSYSTLAWDETVNGWTSFFTYKPTIMGSLKDKFYSTTYSGLFQHNFQGTSNNRNTFYGVSTQPQVTFVFNPQPDLSKNFLTVGYEGSAGWKLTSFISDQQEPQVTPYIDADGDGNFEPNFGANTWLANVDETSSIFSVYEGRYEINNTSNTGSKAVSPPYGYAGFVVKENLYVANLINKSTPRAGEVIFNTNASTGYPMSGIKANYVTATMTTDTITDLNGAKELFAVSTNFSKSGF